MRFFFLFQVLAAFLLCAVAVPAVADEGKSTQIREMRHLGKYIWGPPSTSKVRPYKDGAKLPHNTQWEGRDWTPQRWIDARGGSADAVLNGLYAAGILSDQYEEDGVPVLEVGRTFIELSQLEQIRVAKFVDYMFDVTKSDPNGVFRLVLLTDSYWLWDETMPIGIYSARGLQLQ